MTRKELAEEIRKSLEWGKMFPTSKEIEDSIIGLIETVLKVPLEEDLTIGDKLIYNSVCEVFPKTSIKEVVGMHTRPSHQWPEEEEAFEVGVSLLMYSGRDIPGILIGYGVSKETLRVEFELFGMKSVHLVDYREVKKASSNEKINSELVSEHKVNQNDLSSDYYYAALLDSGYTWIINQNYAIDTYTGLKWKIKAEEGTYTFDEAISKFGISLPTKEEYELAEKHGLREVLVINNGYFWSASVNANSRDAAWTFYGANGYLGYNPRNTLNSVRCVKRDR